MKKFELRTLVILLLVLYTAAIMIIEIKTTQDFVRHFLTDIEGPVHFYAINTSLSVTLLLFTSLLFAVNLLCINNIKRDMVKFYFYASQVAVFAYLGLDDRFMFHEKMKSITGIDGDLLIISVAVSELILLYKLGNIREMNKRTKVYLFLGASFFAMMIVFDSFFPSDMMLRLSMEDLSKTWSVFFLFFFAWEILKENLNRLKLQKAAH